jgi:hypothetical protein
MHTRVYTIVLENIIQLVHSRYFHNTRIQFIEVLGDYQELQPNNSCILKCFIIRSFCTLGLRCLNRLVTYYSEIRGGGRSSSAHQVLRDMLVGRAYGGGKV